LSRAAAAEGEGRVEKEEDRGREGGREVGRCCRAVVEEEGEEEEEEEEVVVVVVVVGGLE